MAYSKEILEALEKFTAVLDQRTQTEHAMGREVIEALGRIEADLRDHHAVEQANLAENLALVKDMSARQVSFAERENIKVQYLGRAATALEAISPSSGLRGEQVADLAGADRNLGAMAVDETITYAPTPRAFRAPTSAPAHVPLYTRAPASSAVFVAPIPDNPIDAICEISKLMTINENKLNNARQRHAKGRDMTAEIRTRETHAANYAASIKQLKAEIETGRRRRSAECDAVAAAGTYPRGAVAPAQW